MNTSKDLTPDMLIEIAKELDSEYYAMNPKEMLKYAYAYYAACRKAAWASAELSEPEPRPRPNKLSQMVVEALGKNVDPLDPKKAIDYIRKMHEQHPESRIAKMLGVNYATVRNWLLGKNHPNEKSAAKIVKLMVRKVEDEKEATSPD